jgi:hypothetical protein
MYRLWHRGLHARGFTVLRDSGGLDIRATWSSLCARASARRLTGVSATGRAGLC